MKGKDTFDEKKLDEVKELSKQGYTEAELAKKLNVSIGNSK